MVSSYWPPFPGHHPDDRSPEDLPGAALLLLQRLIDSEERCDRLQSLLHEAGDRAARLAFDIRLLEEVWAPTGSAQTIAVPIEEALMPAHAGTSGVD
jgi:hypothetical protein